MAALVCLHLQARVSSLMLWGAQAAARASNDCGTRHVSLHVGAPTDTATSTAAQSRWHSDRCARLHA
eukprot:1217746-Alexandrium_andersonii.AAC.2